MGHGGTTDFLPIWVVFLATVAVVLLSIEGGYRLGRCRRRRSEQEDRPPVGEMVAATLALLAFLLAFTFGLAASRFDVRRGLVIDEANAIGTTYLRAAMLPEPHRSEVRTLLREYVAVRLEAVEPGKLGRSIARSQEFGPVRLEFPNIVFGKVARVDTRWRLVTASLPLGRIKGGTGARR